ncbi:hypothetical protein [Cupriavidus taiwanensis]|uniref:hypothetical protein n=1 Tax=Cupriavidus taiwanensis TaxID=164546 RepID=UPI001F0044CF|nr:hypothetical protein [Cupriavidus taiwanensis]
MFHFSSLRMSRSQTICALQQSRGQTLELLEDLHEKAAIESRLMTPLEAAKFDAAMAAPSRKSTPNWCHCGARKSWRRCTP